MNAPTKQTPTPWVADNGDSGVWVIANAETGDVLAELCKDHDAQDEANAAFIVRACNSDQGISRRPRHRRADMTRADVDMLMHTLRFVRVWSLVFAALCIWQWVTLSGWTAVSPGAVFSAILCGCNIGTAWACSDSIRKYGP